MGWGRSAPSETTQLTVKAAGWGGSSLTVDNRQMQQGTTLVESDVVVNISAYNGTPAANLVLERHAIVVKGAGAPAITADPFTQDAATAQTPANATGSITLPAVALLADGDIITVPDADSTTSFKVDKSGTFFSSTGTVLPLSGKAKGTITAVPLASLANGNGFTIDDGVGGRGTRSFAFDVDGTNMLPGILLGKNPILLSGKAQGALTCNKASGGQEGQTFTIYGTVFEFRALQANVTPGRTWIDTSSMPNTGDGLAAVLGAALNASSVPVTAYTSVGSSYVAITYDTVGTAGNVALATTVPTIGIMFGMAFGAATAYTTAALVAQQIAAWFNTYMATMGITMDITATVYETSKVGLTNTHVGIAGNIAISSVTGVTASGMSGGTVAAAVTGANVATILDAAINADVFLDVTSVPTGAVLALIPGGAGYQGNGLIATTNNAVTVAGMSGGVSAVVAGFVYDDDNLVGIGLASLPNVPLTIAVRRSSVVAPTP